jgi:hypothetical protein
MEMSTLALEALRVGLRVVGARKRTRARDLSNAQQ